MRGPVVCQLWWVDLLCASYDERTYCMPVMMSNCMPVKMSRPIVCQLWWEVQLYANYDERTYCIPAMMRGPICGYYDDKSNCMPVMIRSYCMSVMMQRPIVHQLWVALVLAEDGRIYCTSVWWEDLLYASCDTRTYCTPVMMGGTIVCQLWWEETKENHEDEFYVIFCLPVLYFSNGFKVHLEFFQANVSWNYRFGSYVVADVNLAEM